MERATAKTYQSPPPLDDVALSDEALKLLLLLRDEWVMFVEARLPYAYLMKAGQKLRRVPRLVASELIGAGEVVPRGPDAFVARPIEDLVR